MEPLPLFIYSFTHALSYAIITEDPLTSQKE